MFGFGESQDAYNQVQNGNHASLTHEAIAAAASFEAMKAWENHERNTGEEVSHGTAKEILAGLAGVAVDRFAEDQGVNWVEREKAKHDAKKNAAHLYDNYNPNQGQYSYLAQLDR